MTFKHREPNLTPDYMTRDGAEKLAARIKAHWQARGFHQLDVKASSPPYGLVQGKPRYDVRSNMLNGLPREALEGER